MNQPEHPQPTSEPGILISESGLIPELTVKKIRRKTTPRPKKEKSEIIDGEDKKLVVKPQNSPKRVYRKRKLHVTEEIPEHEIVFTPSAIEESEQITPPTPEIQVPDNPIISPTPVPIIEEMIDPLPESPQPGSRISLWGTVMQFIHTFTSPKPIAKQSYSSNTSTMPEEKPIESELPRVKITGTKELPTEQTELVQ